MSALKDIADLQTLYGRTSLSYFNPEQLARIWRPFREKYNLTDKEAIDIAGNALTIPEISEIIERKNPYDGAIRMDKEVFAVISEWLQEEYNSFKKISDEEGNTSRGIFAKGEAEAYQDVLATLNAIMTRRHHLPPDIKPHLERHHLAR